MRIAIADDDPELLEHLSSALDDTSHQYEKFRNGTELQTSLKRETYDVVLVDWNMPGRTGLEIIQWATSTLENPPAFILLTSRADKGDVVRGLEAGAVDYVVKPESKEVIFARIEAAGRRVKTPDQERHAAFGDYKIDRLLREIHLARRKDQADGQRDRACHALLRQSQPSAFARLYLWASVGRRA